MARVQLRNLEKVYGGTLKAVHGINLDIRDGEFMVLVGPSGCAKSTTLRMIAGLEEISGGEIIIGDRRVNDLPPAKRSIAMVFQNYALYPHMSVFDNMAYGLKIAGRPKAEIAERVAAAAQLLQLEPYLDRRPRELSGGQRQRVAIGRAIVADPKIFLFDEPLSNLDAELRVHMRSEIAALHARLGNTMVYVTHDQIEAMTLADRIVVLRDGLIEQVGTPRELYSRPDNLFVAQFIGSPRMNILPVERAAEALSGILPPGATQVGMRPENLSLVGPEAGLLAGTVALSEYTGAASMLHITLDEGETLLVVNNGDGPVAGERIGLTIDPKDMHFFDEAGQRSPG